MTDFAAAFRQGQKAAIDAHRARAEVTGILQSLKHQLLRETDGAIEVSLASEGGFMDMVRVASRALDKSGDYSPLPKSIVGNNALSATKREAVLGTFSMPTEGYPCVVTFDRRENRCHDGEALSQALAEMLQNAAVGRLLHQLLSTDTLAVSTGIAHEDSGGKPVGPPPTTE